MRTTVKVEGLRELNDALEQLPKRTQTATLRRVLKMAADPVVTAMKAKAPKLTRDLEQSITAGTRLTKRQARLARREGKSYSEIYVGTANPAGVPQEFGTFKESAQPFARPAWAETQNQALEVIKNELGEEIDKSAKRLARKTAKLAAKG